MSGPADIYPLDSSIDGFDGLDETTFGTGEGVGDDSPAGGFGDKVSAVTLNGLPDASQAPIGTLDGASLTVSGTAAPTDPIVNADRVAGHLLAG